MFHEKPKVAEIRGPNLGPTPLQSADSRALFYPKIIMHQFSTKNSGML